MSRRKKLTKSIYHIAFRMPISYGLLNLQCALHYNIDPASTSSQCLLFLFLVLLFIIWGRHCANYIYKTASFIGVSARCRERESRLELNLRWVMVCSVTWSYTHSYGCISCPNSRGPRTPVEGSFVDSLFVMLIFISNYSRLFYTFQWE